MGTAQGTRVAVPLIVSTSESAALGSVIAKAEAFCPFTVPFAIILEPDMGCQCVKSLAAEKLAEAHLRSTDHGLGIAVRAARVVRVWPERPSGVVDITIMCGGRV